MTSATPQPRDETGQRDRREQRKSASAYYPSMLTIAGQLGCQIETGKENPTLLKGVCPFHEAPTMQQSKTLQIDAKTSRFVCHYCEAEGNPVAFAAMVWGVSATDAHLLLTNHGTAVSAARPSYPPSDNRNGQPPEWNWTTRLNSAVLTRASQHYQRLLYTSYPALSMLAKMGVPPELAEKAGIGYSSGTGLTEYLAGAGISPEEMGESPLFNLVNQVESFTGRITLADCDYTGATVWMTSIWPEPVENQGQWKERRPNTLGLPGQKPYLFNIHRIAEHAPCVHITDDPRLYIILASQGIPTTLLTQRRRRGEPPEVRGEKTASRLMRKQPMKIVLAMHDRQTRTIIETTIRDHHEDKEIVLHGRPAILANLDPKTRDLEALAAEGSITRLPRPDSAPSPGAPEQEGTPQETSEEMPDKTSGETSEKMSELTPSPRTADGQRPDGDPSPALSKSTPQPDPEPDPRPDPPGDTRPPPDAADPALSQGPGTSGLPEGQQPASGRTEGQRA